MSKKLCRFGWHQWGVWGMPQTSKVTGYLVQHRFCKCCGRQDHRISWPKQKMPEQALYDATVVKGGE